MHLKFYYNEMEKQGLIARIRIICLLFFIYFAFNVTWQSIVALGMLLASIFLLKEHQPYYSANDGDASVDPMSKNPLKGKPKIQESDLQAEYVVNAHRAILNFIFMDHDPLNAKCLHNFSNLKDNSQCHFAKRAKLWGNFNWNDNFSIEENIYRCIPLLIKFCLYCEPLGLDGFLIELPGNQYAANVKAFGQFVRRTLTAISDNDPYGFHCMSKSYIGRRGWGFQFNKVHFFVTTFAPCYPETSPRYGFECENAYILLQPEVSFAQYDIPFDTPDTDWDNPKTVREKIRVAFKEAGRPYKIRDTIHYPVVHDIVKPLMENDDVIPWWKQGALENDAVSS